MGGGGQLDIRVNLAPLCRFCHGDVHTGAIDDDSLLALVAMREGVMQHHIREIVWELRRTPKHKCRELSERAKAQLPEGWESWSWG
jgi:hypothetical protein